MLTPRSSQILSQSKYDRTLKRYKRYKSYRDGESWNHAAPRTFMCTKLTLEEINIETELRLCSPLGCRPHA